MAYRKSRRTLPLAIINRSDVNRLLWELQEYDEHMVQLALRPNKTHPVDAPEPSQKVTEIASVHHYDIASAKDRTELKDFLTDIKNNAPQVHISFASEPSSKALHTITEWFRAEIHPQILVQTGIQPSIVAGCIVRTTNKEFDLNLGQRLQGSKTALIQKIGAMRAA